jgi:hypothetical protein
VRYYTDVLDEDYLTSFFEDDGTPKRGPDGKPLHCRSDFNLNCWDPNWSHEEIDRHIQMSAPAHWFKVLEHAKLNTSSAAMDKVKEKMNKEHVFTHVPPPIFDPNAVKKDEKAVSDAEIEEFVKKLTNV